MRTDEAENIRDNIRRQIHRIILARPINGMIMLAVTQSLHLLNLTLVVFHLVILLALLSVFCFCSKVSEELHDGSILIYLFFPVFGLALGVGILFLPSLAGGIFPFASFQDRGSSVNGFFLEPGKIKLGEGEREGKREKRSGSDRSSEGCMGYGRCICNELCMYIFPFQFQLEEKSKVIQKRKRRRK